MESLAIPVLSSLLWLWGAQAKHSFILGGADASSLFHGYRCWKCKPCSPEVARATAASLLAYTPSLSKDGLTSLGGLVLHLPSSRPNSAPCCCVSPRRRDEGGDGVECHMETCSRHWLLHCGGSGDPERCIPSSSSGGTEAFPLGLVEHAAGAWLSTDFVVSIACCCFSCLTFCSLYSSITCPCSIFYFPLGGFTWL